MNGGKKKEIKSALIFSLLCGCVRAAAGRRESGNMRAAQPAACSLNASCGTNVHSRVVAMKYEGLIDLMASMR